MIKNPTMKILIMILFLGWGKKLKCWNKKIKSLIKRLECTRKIIHHWIENCNKIVRKCHRNYSSNSNRMPSNSKNLSNNHNNFLSYVDNFHKNYPRCNNKLVTRSTNSNKSYKPNNKNTNKTNHNPKHKMLHKNKGKSPGTGCGGTEEKGRGRKDLGGSWRKGRERYWSWSKRFRGLGRSWRIKGMRKCKLRLRSISSLIKFWSLSYSKFPSWRKKLMSSIKIVWS